MRAWLVLTILLIGRPAFAGTDFADQVKGSVEITKAKASTLKAWLTRSADAKGFEAEAYLMTFPLSERQEQEAGEKNMSGADEIKKNVDAAKRDFARGAICFVTSIGGPTLADAQAKNWIAKIKTSSGKMINANLSGFATIPSSIGDKWMNFGSVCARDKSDLAKGITLYLIPQFERAERLEMAWP